MLTKGWGAFFLFAVTISLAAGAAEQTTPVIPVGLDAYRMWDKWPYQRIGARAYMRSTYDRTGGNRGVDAAHFLYQTAEDFNVTLDVEGRGVLYFVRTNHWHGSPWHYEIDGKDHIVRETTTADPTQKLEHSVFIPERLFPNPLTWTYSITKGADLMWVPIPFEERLRLAYSRTFYGTGYYIYHLYDPAANLSLPIRAWDAQTPPAADVLDLLKAAGTDIAPKLDSAEGQTLGLREFSGVLDLPTDAATHVATLTDAPAMVRALTFSVPRKDAVAFGQAHIRITWDERPCPSVEGPIALFFGTGTLHNRENKEYLVKAVPVNVRFDEERVHLACYFPMPFFKSARIELISSAEEPIRDVRWSIRTQPYTDPANHVGYFHATYRDHGQGVPGQDNVFLDTREAEGGGEWSGSLVGTSFVFSDRANLNTLEGDPRFFFDDSQTPQAQGTGTEEWGGGGDYWGGLNMTLPLAGHPVGIRDFKDAKSPEDLVQSAYRYLLADLMPFGTRCVVQMEHGARNTSRENYRSLTYWYGLPAPSLLLTDQLDVGNVQSEKAHAYFSPNASEPYEITSRYEWGVDTIPHEGDHPVPNLNPIQVYPAHTEDGRTTKTFSEFTIKVSKYNLGVMLRRTLDYQYPNQRAKVYVADAYQEQPVWKDAGIWYLAGSNTCYHSWPVQEGELAKSAPEIITSNRRFRDDEFLISRNLTQGRDAIRVRVDFTPMPVPLLPDKELPELAWSEITYAVYSVVIPQFSL